MEGKLNKYRDELTEGLRLAQEQYDKVLLSLSGGAFGISFAFIDKLAPADHIESSSILISAWSFWGLSIMLSLISLYSGTQAFLKAIKQVKVKGIEAQNPGGYLDQITGTLNLLAGIAFVAGVVCLIIFVSKNYGV